MLRNSMKVVSGRKKVAEKKRLWADKRQKAIRFSKYNF
jgi:hypothetical protein